MKPDLKIALLPLYLELYDTILPEARDEQEAFVVKAVDRLQSKGLDVVRLPVCRLKQEFQAAIQTAESSGSCAIVTLHLAYSPSLESIEALSKTRLPLIVLDTTQDSAFPSTDDPKRILFNHGIHGVQDMCNLLLRHNKPFSLEAGHMDTSDVVDRLIPHIRAAQAAHNMKNARVGLLGSAFEGMGDFSVPEAILRNIGMTVVTAALQDIAALLPAEDSAEVEQEMAVDTDRFDTSSVAPESHRRAVRTGLALRKWIDKENLTAFSLNFLEVTKASGLPVMPFLEISKQMESGVGYGGEGDILTASLVGALTRVYHQVSFTEMFCPDWDGNTIFLSHMGEINPTVCEKKPVFVEKPWTFTDADSPIVATGAFKPGSANIVNLAPGPDDTFSLIIAPVTVVPEGETSRFKELIRGWIQPAMVVSEFLKAYSLAGGTHHKAIVYGDYKDELITFAALMGWKGVVIE